MLFLDENTSNVISKFPTKFDSGSSTKFIEKSQINLITSPEDFLFCNGNVLTTYHKDSDHIIEETYKFTKIYSSFNSDQLSLVKSTFLEGKNVLLTTIGYDFFPPIITSDFLTNNYLLFKQFELDSSFEIPSNFLRSQSDFNLSPITVISKKKHLNYLIILCLPVSNHSSYISDLISKLTDKQMPSIPFFSNLFFHLSDINLFLKTIDSTFSINILHSIFPKFSSSFVPFETYFSKRIHQQINSLTFLQNENGLFHLRKMISLQNAEPDPKYDSQLRIHLEQKNQIEQQIINFKNLLKKIQSENEVKRGKIEEMNGKLQNLIQERQKIEDIIHLMIFYTKEMKDEIQREEKRKEQQINCIDALLLLEPSEKDSQITQERSQKIRSIIDSI